MNGKVQRLNLSAYRLKALTMHERFVFALSGHVFNELMLMQKLMHVSRRPPEDTGPLADGSVCTSLFILRVLVAKTALSDPIEFDAPDFNEFRLPYFYGQEHIAD